VIVSERLSLALATHVGKGEAHALTETLTRDAVTQGRSLRVLAGESPIVAANLEPSELDALFDPANALGSAEAFVDRAIAARNVRD
jgi:3-carboxy-cis,cis-muconate cycloisomerase